MPDIEDPTSWQMILAAGAGQSSQQQRFVSRYDSLIRATLHRRWRNATRRQLVDDACQDVFFECFRQDGVLERMHQHRPDRFRAFLVAVILNVARATEKRQLRSSRDGSSTPAAHGEADVDADRDLLAWFEKQWARTVFADAFARLKARANHSARRATRTSSQLLQLRFEEGLPIRAIAKQWQVAPERVHREYARARREFHECLKAAVLVHEDLSAADLDEECRQLARLMR